MTNLIRGLILGQDRQLIHVQPDVSIKQCVEMMVSHKIGAVVVMDDYNVLGVLSERDIVFGLVYKGLDAREVKAVDLACANVPVLKPSDSIESAMELITQTKRRHVLVMENKAVLSIISIGDILFHVLQNKDHVIDQLEHYIGHK